MKRWLALTGGAVLLTLAWPGPSGAQTALGGYSGVARADAIHVEIFDPTIPLPTDPQIDLGIAHTKSNTDTGPVSRAVASYLWPGDVIGDGFDQLTGNPDSTYPVQINSRFPATTTAPAHNTAQISDGNGMTTSSSETTTRATASGLGVSGTTLNNPTKGLCQIFNPKKCSKTPPATPQLPVQVTKQVSTLITMSGGSSSSTVTVGKNSVTSEAHATGTGIKLLGGLITIGEADITTKTVSDGKKAVTTGTSDISSVSIGGKSLGIDGKNLNLAGSKVKIPALPSALTDLLKEIGISFDYATSTKTVSGADGSLSASGLVITVDTKLLHDALAPLTGVLADLLNKIPNASEVTALLGLGPKMEFIVGDVTTSATAQPAFVGGPPAGGSGGATGGGGTGGGAVTGGGSTGGGSTGGTGGGLPSTGGGNTTPSTAPTTPTQNVAQPTAFGLPGLGSVPRLLILGGLVLAGAIGWLFRGAGGFILGGGRNCKFGLSTGVPDLRKG